MAETIGVIGAGTMGNGIAQTAAGAGFEVVMCDIDQAFLERGVQNIGKSLDRFVKKETMTEEQKAEVGGMPKEDTNPFVILWMASGTSTERCMPTAGTQP